MDNVELIHARADLAVEKGRTCKDLRKWSELLRVAQAALRSGRSEVAAERIETVVREITARL